MSISSNYFSVAVDDDLLSRSARDIVADMEKIRADTIVGYATLAHSGARPDDYLNLAYRLGTYMISFDSESLRSIADVLNSNGLFEYYDYRFLESADSENFAKLGGLIESAGKKLGVERGRYHMFQGFLALDSPERVAPYRGGLPVYAIKEVVPGIAKSLLGERTMTLEDVLYEEGVPSEEKNCFVFGAPKDRRCEGVDNCSENALRGCDKFDVMLSMEFLPERGVANVSYAKPQMLDSYGMFGKAEELAAMLGYAAIVSSTVERHLGGLRSRGYSAIKSRVWDGRPSGDVWKPLKI